MLKHHLKITWRNILKNKATGFINLLGLTLGLTTAMLIGIYVHSEWQTDRWIPEPDRTFRLVRQPMVNNETYQVAVTSAIMPVNIEQDYSQDVESMTRILDGNSVIAVADQIYQEEGYFYVDPNFLDFFGYPLLHGDTKTALSKSHTVVLTAKTARKYFGNEAAAMGQTLKVDNNYDAIVTGVIADFNQPSHINFEILESNLAFRNQEWWSNSESNFVCTYLRLIKGVSSTEFESKLVAFVDKHWGEEFVRLDQKPFELVLQPIREVYFAKDVKFDPVQHGNKEAVNIFFLAVLFLLIIACANYINLATVQAIKRNKEVGVLKVLGSNRKSIIGQMLAESFLFTLTSVLLAIQLTIFALPYFEQAFELDLAFNLPIAQVTAALVSLVLIITIAAGLYPGIFLSSFKPVQVLKGVVSNGDNFSSNLRKSLVVFQFVLSVGLLCSTFFIQQQLNFLSQKNLGFDKDHILLVGINNEAFYTNRDLIKQQLKKESGVENISFVRGYPGGFHDFARIQLLDNESIRVSTAYVDFDYVNTFDMEVIAGRDFDTRLATDSTEAVLLNEKAVTSLGITPEEILGKEITFSHTDTRRPKVVGVVKDFHFSSLREQIEPLIISATSDGGMMAIKANGKQIPQAIVAIEKAWTKYSPAFPFSYEFLDERLYQHYENETQQGRVFSLFAAIAIFIACLGMFGLSAFAASIRVKEIGIRKVLGASIPSIIGLLSKDFLKLVLLAFFIAIPFALYFVNGWLNDFAYRIDIHWWGFALAGIAAIGIAFLTVSFQSVKAALDNPAKILKDA